MKLNRAVGDYVFIRPIELNEGQWSGNIVDRGAKVITYTTYYPCDLVLYNNDDIYMTTKFEGNTVHVVSYENIIKIEGVY